MKVEQDGEGGKEGKDKGTQVCQACWSMEGLGEGALVLPQSDQLQADFESYRFCQIQLY